MGPEVRTDRLATAVLKTMRAVRMDQQGLEAPYLLEVLKALLKPC